MARFPFLHGLTAVVSLMAIAAPLGAQEKAQTNRPVFEVASVKLHEGSLTMSGVIPEVGGRISVVAATLKGLIAAAYGVKEREIFGGPEWVEADRYNIEAKASGPAPWEPDMRLMLQSLLADRFQLTVHTETREMPAYELRIAKGGTKMTADTADCPSRADGSCGGFITKLGLMQAQQGDMKQFADSLSRVMDRPVTDKTSLSGRFQNVKLQWTPDENQFKNWGGDALDPFGASLFTALQEQLGLQLQSVRAAVKVIVIDSAKKTIPD